jgi:3'-phosphoadenosine 5'-phosphosulfate sulfotransferase (PAPS reductase)/FAD synthetase
MTLHEPILSREDERIWNSWCATAMMHFRSAAHRRRVDQAKRITSACLEAHPNSAVMWSGGKDSTALSHLVAVELGAKVPLVSEKDDLDFDGEESYLQLLATDWDARLEILRPPISPRQWFAEHAVELGNGVDIHSRAAALSKECFYSVVEADNKKRDAIFLGLRAAESKGRERNLAFNGHTYQRNDGLTICCPIGDWEGIDVYAYLLTHDIGLLPLYRCVALMHAREPWTVRKSWWIPGAASSHGYTAWLRHYWPSLYRQLCDWMPQARRAS